MNLTRLFCILLLVSSLALSSAAPALSQSGSGEPRMVKDINTCTDGSNPRVIAQTDQEVFFVATQANIGASLWRSDGTQGGTQRIKTINAGSDVRFYGFNAWLNGSFFFLTSEDGEVYSLWASDGTAAGTRWIKNIPPAIHMPRVSNPVTMNGAFYFVFYKDYIDNGSAELWRSDGTADGTGLVRPFQVGQLGVFSNLLVYRGNLYFPGWDAEHGTELWRSDGTAAGTGFFAEFDPVYDGLPQNLFVGGDTLYFTARHESDRWLLWTSDGTLSGTRPILTAGYRSHPGRFAYLNGILYFPASKDSGGLRLWRTDGTTQGTWMLKEVSIETLDLRWTSVGTAGGTLYFAANQTELWKSDGTEAGTLRVKSLFTRNRNFAPFSFLDVGGALYFGASDGGSNRALWRSDGTAEGTNLIDNGYFPDRLPDLSAGPWLIQDDQVLFSGYVPCLGRELQRIDESTVVNRQARAVVVADIETKTLESEFGQAVSYLGKVFFAASDGRGQAKIWSSDGSAAGTHLVEDLDGRIKEGAYPYDEAAAANDLLFFTTLDSLGTQLWRMDGTETGAIRLTELQASNPLDGPHGLTAYKNQIYFFNNAAGYEALWVSDGSRAGTHPLIDFGHTLTAAVKPVVLHGWMYFLVSSSSQDQLYRSDGTSAGTRLVKSWPASYDRPVDLLVQAGGKLFFPAWDNDHGQELWMSDGTPDGTRMYADLAPGLVSTVIAAITPAGNRIFFVSQEGSNAYSLWKASADGDAPVRLLNSSHLYALFPASPGSGRYVYFTTGNYTPRTLWRTDGTPGGTIPLNPREHGYTDAGDLAVIGEQAYFRATDAAHGAELWTSDGTLEGTHLAFDLLPGPASSEPERLAPINGALWFRADDGLHGSEPWVYNLLPEKMYLPIVGR